MAKYVDLYEALETSEYGIAVRQYGIGELVVEPADDWEDPFIYAYCIKVASQGNGVEQVIACANLEEVEAKLHEMGLRARMDGWWPMRELGEWGDTDGDDA